MPVSALLEAALVILLYHTKRKLTNTLSVKKTKRNQTKTEDTQTQGAYILVSAKPQNMTLGDESIACSCEASSEVPKSVSSQNEGRGAVCPESLCITYSWRNACEEEGAFPGMLTMRS